MVFLFLCLKTRWFNKMMYGLTSTQITMLNLMEFLHYML